MASSIDTVDLCKTGMKIFGCGGLVMEEQRVASLKFVVNSNKVDAMTIGFEDAI